jgi:hypothetical protein
MRKVERQWGVGDASLRQPAAAGRVVVRPRVVDILAHRTLALSAIAAFEGLPDTEAAKYVVAELKALLEPHLAAEEAEVVQFLRAAKEFPAPATDAEAELYAQGFAWSTHGIADEVLERVFSILPESLTSRLPAARADFERRCERVWGSARAGSATTPIPNAP